MMILPHSQRFLLHGSSSLVSQHNVAVFVWEITRSSYSIALLENSPKTGTLDVVERGE